MKHYLKFQGGQWSQAGKPIDKVSEFSYPHFKPVNQEGQTNIKAQETFNKIKNIYATPENAYFITTDLVGLYTTLSWSGGTLR